MVKSCREQTGWPAAHRTVRRPEQEAGAAPAGSPVPWSMNEAGDESASGLVRSSRVWLYVPFDGWTVITAGSRGGRADWLGTGMP